MTSSPQPLSESRACSEATPFVSVETALEELRSGQMVVVCDDAGRQHEGDLLLAAQFADADAVNFMATHGCGLVSLALTGERCDRLELPQMVEHNSAPHRTAFTVSVEARDGVSTGISAHDRARTIEIAIDPRSAPSDLVVPGHVFPLRARDGGVLERPATPRPRSTCRGSPAYLRRA